MDELVRIPDRASWTKAERALAALLLVSAGAVVGGTAAVDTAFPSSGEKPIGQEARDLYEARRNRRFVDGSAAKWLEKELEVRSTVRRSLAPYWSAFLMKAMGAVPRDLVVGEDGWLFRRDRITPPKATRDRGLAVTALATAAIQRRLGQLGATLIVIPLPRKAVACREKLPSGIDSDASYEAELQASLDQLGVGAIDVTKAWEHLDVTDRYLRQDSHWAFGAEWALVEALSAAYPRLAAGPYAFEWREESRPAHAALLNYVAIGEDHPVVPWVAGDNDVTLVPKADNWAIDPNDRNAAEEIAVVGTSFTKIFGFAPLVAFGLGRRAYPGGMLGTPFAGTLANFLGEFPSGGVLGELPKTVLFEFPVHQAFALGKSVPSASTTLASFFLAADVEQPFPLPAGKIAGLQKVPEPGRGLCAGYPAGSLLTTGDGVMQLRVTLKSKKKNTFELRCGAAPLRFQVNVGQTTVVLPVLQLPGESHPAELRAVRNTGPGLEVDIEPVVDANLGLGTTLALEKRGPRTHACDEEVALGLHDVATVTWGGAPESVSVRILGRLPDGRSREVRVQTESPLSSIAVLSLTPFRGGTVQSIEVEGDVTEAVAAVSPQP